MRIPIVLALLGVAASALAQDAGEDWELIRLPQERSTFAFLPTTAGLTIAFRCIDGSYAAVIAGLPEARRNDRTRVLLMTRDGHPPSPTVWNVTTDRTVAIADYPAATARGFRRGGRFDIIVPGGAEGGRNLRYSLELPASAAAIDETLTACDRPLDDPRDDLLPEIGPGGLPVGVVWAERPEPRYPRTHYSEGYAITTCLMRADGGLDQCQIESEFPLDGGFGRASLRAVGDARLSSPNETEGAYLPRVIGFRTNFRMP